ncbi:Gag-Pol polyprotein [Gossypium australe]|uniref:Gag-Pol polyprotein n=1 Tax=Gossypium australe TaxID=47621 RepID=A0A5B6VMZ4_9ROSI|nr:Gag-Pol polyprotein [Gossypium australe]
MLRNPILTVNTGEGCYIYWYQSYGLVDSRTNVAHQMDPNRAIADEVESNALAFAQRTAPSDSRPITAPQGVELLRLNKPPINKIRKHGAEEFRANVDDDPERAEFWLENMIRVFDELSCTLAECLKCAISLLRDTLYQWWNTQIFLDQKHKEFLELTQGRMTVTEYEREFVRLSKYAREYVSTEEIMCKQFVDGLNEDIKLLVGILDLKEFVMLVDRACKVEYFSREKKKADSEARDLRKRSMNKPSHSSSKKFRDSYGRSNASVGYQNRDCGNQSVNSKAQATSISSVGSLRNNKLECQQCGRRHFGEWWNKSTKDCFKCGWPDHFIKDCPEMDEKDRPQNLRPSNMSTRGRPPRNARNVSGSQGAARDSTLRSEARAPARAFAIRARKEASSPDVITGTLSLYHTNVITLIDPGLTHLYVCENLMSSMKLPIEITKFMIKASNPLGKYVLVDKVCKNCPLMTQGNCFSADLMLLPFDEFDVILGMVWLTLHDAVVNCRRKTIELKCQNNEILRIESDESNVLPIVISLMSAQRYMRKGCDAYLAYVLDTKVSEKKIESVPVVCEYPDVFPEELSGLPPVREVKFAIELVLGTSPISIAPYRMALTELKELKI